jgi:hypothetical protein
VTVHIPKALLVVLALVVVVAAVGYGGYTVGRSSRQKEVDAGREAKATLAQLKASNYIVSKRLMRTFGRRADLMAEQVCSQVVRLPNPLTGNRHIGAVFCDVRTGEPKGGYTINTVDFHWRQYVMGMCEALSIAADRPDDASFNCPLGLPDFPSHA